MSGGLAFSYAPVEPLAVIDEARNVYATPEQLLGWVGGARKGDEFAYATRCVSLLPGGRKVAGTVTDLYQRGYVVPVQRRIPGGFDKNYVVQRTGKVWKAPEPESDGLRGKKPSVVVVDEMQEVEAVNTLLAVLDRFARFGRPCPTDAQLADRAGMSKAQVKASLELLRGTGAIVIASAPAPTLRKITIVATGHSTGMVK